MRRIDHINGVTTVSYDSLPLPLDIATAEQHLRRYDTVLKVSPGFTSSLINHVSVVKYDDAYNCGICVLTTTIVYLYHPDPCTSPWYSLNYPSAALHIRNIIIAIIQTGQVPVLTHVPINPLPPLIPIHTSRTSFYPHAANDNRSTPAPEQHRNITSNIEPATHTRPTLYGGTSPHHSTSCHQLHSLSLTKIAT